MQAWLWHPFAQSWDVLESQAGMRESRIALIYGAGGLAQPSHSRDMALASLTWGLSLAEAGQGPKLQMWVLHYPTSLVYPCWQRQH